MFGLAVDYRKIAALFVVVGVVVLVVVFRLPVFSALLPFFMALILANVLEPAVTWMGQRLKLPRSLATLLTLGTLLFVVGYAALWILSNLYREVVELAATLPAYEKTIGQLVAELTEQAENLFEQFPRDWLNIFRDHIDEELDTMLKTLVDVLKGVTNSFVGGIASLPAVFVTGVVTVLATYFFSTDKETVDASLLRTVPLDRRATLAELRDKILVDLVGFFKAQFLLFTINTALAAVWLVVVGARYWMLASLVLGILDVIPVLGPGLVLVPWAAVALWQGDVALTAQLLGLFAAMFAARQVLQAKILGDSIGIHPLLMLFALWSGIVVFGVWGFLIGPVIVIFGKAVWNTGLIPYFRDEPEPAAPVATAAPPAATPPGAKPGTVPGGGEKAPVEGAGAKSPAPAHDES